MGDLPWYFQQPPGTDLNQYILDNGGTIPEDAPPFYVPLVEETAAAQEIQEAEKEGPQRRTISVRASKSPRQLCYGFCRVGGTITFITADQGTSGQFLHIYVTFAGHETWKIQDIIVDGEVVDFPATVDGGGRRIFGWATAGSKWENLIFANVQTRGTDDQTANYDARAQSDALFPGKWTDAHRQRGNAGVYFILKYDADVFKNGPPEIAFEGYWHNQIYDPRDTSYKWTANAALVLCNYMTDTKYGPGIPYSDFDETNLIDAANICDESVTLADTSTENRYEINGFFPASRSYNHQKVIQDMARAMAGEVVYSQGKWLILPGKWRTPSVTFDENDLRSGVSILAKPTKANIFNAVKGRFFSPANNWQDADYPAVTNTLYESEDGERIYKELDLPYTTSHAAAQRIAKVLLEQSRQWITVSAKFSLKAYQVRPGDVIQLSLERFGWATKEFRVLDFQYVPTFGQTGPTVEIALTLKETASGIYDWNNGEETTVDLAPNTDLIIDPQPITGLTLESGTNQLYIRSDGTVFTRIKVSWDATTDVFVLTGGQIEIQFKMTDDVDWITAGLVDGGINSFFILDVKDGESYDVRVRTISIRRSEWTTELGHFVVGKTANPSTPINFSATATEQGVVLEWDAIDDLDVAAYEVRVGVDWATGTRIVITKTTRYLWKTQTAGSYVFWLRAIDTSKNYSNDAAATLTVAGPGVIQSLTSLVVYNMVQLRWNVPATWTFPIDHYNIYRGLEGGGLLFVGDTSATIAIYQEPTGGRITYGIAAVDIAGNVGPIISTTLDVDPPVDFELIDDQLLDYAAATTMTNIVIEQLMTGTRLVCPVPTSQTYSAHFTDNSWSTPQDQLDAGYPLYIQPALTSNAVYEHQIDYGGTLSGSLVTFSFNKDWKDGGGTVAVTVSHSLNGSSWTDTSGQQVFAENFRYVKVKIDVTPNDDTSILTLSELRVRLDVKTESDSGIVSANSADGSGTLVTFNKTFLDVQSDSIVLTYNGSSAYFASYTWNDPAQELRVFLWDTGGNRVSGSVKWSAIGAVSTT